MFIGHYAAAFAAERRWPAVGLGPLVLGVNFIDLIYPFFLLAGLERVTVDPSVSAFTPLAFYYPFTHSLAGTLVWAALAGGVYRAVTGSVRGGWIMAGAVASHWVLDFVSHTPDLPLWPGGPLAGLGLWNSVTATLVVEGSLFAGAVWYFARGRRLNGKARILFVAFVALLVVSYLGFAFGPPPEHQGQMVGSLLAQWVLVGMAYWFDRLSRRAA